MEEARRAYSYPCFICEKLQPTGLIVQTLLKNDRVDLRADGLGLSRWKDIVDLKVQSLANSCAVVGNCSTGAHVEA